MIAVDDLEVVSQVGFGEGVILTAILLDDIGEFLRLELFRAAEHEMLAQMRDSGLAELFVARAHFVEDVEGRNRRLMVFEQEHLQAIRQSFEFDRVGDSRVRQSRGGEPKQYGERTYRGDDGETGIRDDVGRDKSFHMHGFKPVKSAAFRGVK